MSDILCAGHAIKEVLSAGECLGALEAGVRAADQVISGSYIISDGGDGFLDACQQFSDGELQEAVCTAPLGDSITAPFLFDQEKQTAYIEMALCSGLRLVEPHRRNIMISSSAGLGDLVAAAKAAGAKKIYVGLGGSATCDGGIGFLWKLADHAEMCQPGVCNEPRVAMDMPDLPSPDIIKLRDWLGDIELTALVDVNNPLLGPQGAAKVFAPQKGADHEQTEQLDAWMGEWCQRVQRNAGMELCGQPGTGAAGGLGFAMAVLGGELIQGAEAVCELSGLSASLRSGNTLLTAEGRFDMTSLSGKAPWTAAIGATKASGKAVIFCGLADDDAVKAAKDQSVQIIEFGRDLPEDERQERSAAMLQNAVTHYLRDRNTKDV